MFPIEKITPIVDLIIDIEKENPIEKLIDMNCTFANSGAYLQKYLTSKKNLLSKRQNGESKIIGTFSNVSQKPKEPAIYDNIMPAGFAEIISYLKKENADILLLLDLTGEKITADILTELMRYTKSGILLNASQQEDPSFKKFIQQFDEFENLKNSSHQTKRFRLKVISINIYYLERIFQHHNPVFYFDADSENNSFTLTTENSVLEYYVPIGSAFMRLKTVRDKKGGDLQVYADGKLLMTELQAYSDTDSYHYSCFRLPAGCSKIRLNLNPQTFRGTEMVSLSEVSFS